MEGLEQEFADARGLAVMERAREAIDAVHDLAEARCARIDGRERSAGGLTEEEARDELADALLALQAA